MTAEKIKGCPFCGAIPTVKPWHGGGPRKRAIFCDNDECAASPMLTGTTRSRAIRLWNTRVRPAPEEWTV